MYPLAQVPALDGNRASFAHHEQRVRFRNQSTEADPANRASTLIPRMGAIARRVRFNARGGTFLRGEDVGNSLRVLRNYLRPDAVGNIHRQVTRLPQYACADQTSGRCLLEFEFLCRKAEDSVIMGEACVSFSRMQIWPCPEMRNRARL